MKMPLSIRPEFIGRLIKLEAEHKGNPPIFERLCQLVKQCREFNGGITPREQIWPFMVRTQQELAQRGIAVG
jgi:hypothetical protein